ncbi:odorant receptor 4-like [Bradysia coprophila]|uniref:odorant receptor 4-like n=1 Tax=Bradysia coprophila TaxID=38358 RepID=UPI00187D76FF|nr:odorant receptor 4-like [Bradysia coprophila]
MHPIRIHKVISLMNSMFYRFGFWHRGVEPTVEEIRVKFFYCIYYSFYVLSLVIGSIKCQKMGESIYLADLSVGAFVVCVKVWILVWKQDEIINLLDRVCVFLIRNYGDHNRFNEKHEGFIKFVIVFVMIVIITGLSVVFLSFTGKEKKLFLGIGFPLDYKNSDIAFWIATIFIFIGVLLSIVAIFFTTVIWYLLFMCTLRYEVLGSELKNMGRIDESGNGKMTVRQMRNHFFEDVKRSIVAHLHLTGLTSDVESFILDLFLIQFGTSGLCICGSVYCLAFDVGDNLLERVLHIFVLIYFIAELFMITYFGNEIMLSSNRLSYSLFESEWYDQPQSTKTNILIFGEYLKQSQVLVIGKLYPLTLETFTRILNSAYSMFNILKSF